MESIKFDVSDFCCLCCCIPFGMIIGVAMVIIAAKYIDQCPAESSLPYLLLGKKINSN